MKTKRSETRQWNMTLKTSPFTDMNILTHIALDLIETRVQRRETCQVDHTYS